MKKQIIMALMLGCAVGVFVDRIILGHRSNRDPSIPTAPVKDSSQLDQQSGDPAANNQVLAGLYPTAIGLRIMTDLRLIDRLSQGDTSTASNIIVLDIRGGVASLSGLQKCVRITEFDSNSWAEGQRFLQKLDHH